MERSETLRDGTKVTIRRGRADALDAMALLVFLQTISQETTNTYMVPEEVERITVDQEVTFLEQTRKDGQLFLVAEVEGEIVGSLGVMRRLGARTLHRCEFGITVMEKYWGFGIGTMLIDMLIEWARTEQITKVELRVRVDNERAIALYRKLGFLDEGCLKNAMKVGKAHYDELCMGLDLMDVVD